MTNIPKKPEKKEGLDHTQPDFVNNNSDAQYGYNQGLTDERAYNKATELSEEEIRKILWKEYNLTIGWSGQIEKIAQAIITAQKEKRDD